MHPILFRLFDVAFPSYFMLLVSGFLLATVAAVTWARRIGQDPDVMVDLGLTALMAGVIGARLLHVLVDGYFWDYVHICTNPILVDWKISRAECLSANWAGTWDAARAVCHPSEPDCFAWARFWAGGLTYYGGFAGALLAARHVLARDHFPYWKAADMAGMVVPLGLCYGRMGCLLAGCCFGVETHLPWALSFPPNSPASEHQFKAGLLTSQHLSSLGVHPTQVYESALSLCIAFYCALWVHPRKRYDGQVFVTFLVLYGAVRFLLEGLRSDDRGGLFGLSTSQLLSILFIGLALALHVRRSRGRDLAKLLVS